MENGSSTITSIFLNIKIKFNINMDELSHTLSPKTIRNSSMINTVTKSPVSKTDSLSLDKIIVTASIRTYGLISKERPFETPVK